MKRLISTLLAMALLISCCPIIPLSAKAETEGDYLYTIESGEATITGYQGAGGDIIIPEALGGYPVTVIGELAFRNCDSLTAVIIPPSVTTIEESAFYYCGVISVTMSAGITSVGAYAFFGCDNLTVVYFTGTEEQWNAIEMGVYNSALVNANVNFVKGGPCGEKLTWTLDAEGTLTISGTGAMWDYSAMETMWRSYSASVKTVVIENGVTSIGSQTFRDCVNLTSLTIPDSVTAIGISAFYNCDNLTLLAIPDMVTTVGDFVVSNCDNLRTVTVGKGVTSISKYAFNGCDSLTGIWVDADNTTYSSDNRGVLFNKNKTVLLQAPGALSGAYTVPDTVRSIGTDAFSERNNLTTVTIPNSVVTIGTYAFAFCENLSSVNISASVTAVENYAFYYCDNLTDIYYDGTEKQWNAIHFGAGTQSINRANIHFTEQKLIAEGTCGENLTWTLDEEGTLTISGTGEMDDYSNVRKDMPWYSYNTSISRVVIEEGVTTIGDSAFYQHYFKSISIPASLISIGRYAFSYTYYLDTVCIADVAAWVSTGLKNSGSNPMNAQKEPLTKNLYLNGELLTDLEIPQTVTHIRDEAFAYCGSLESVKIPSSVVSIGANAFSRCRNVKKLYIEDIDCWTNIALGSVGSNPVYASLAEETEIYVNNVLTTELVISEGTTRLSPGIFAGFSAVTSIQLPDTLTSIGSYAFENCYALETIAIPKSVTSIGEGAFGSCKSLVQISLPDGITEIGVGTFYDCSELTKVSVPNSVVAIGSNAFANCNKLESVNIPEGVTTIEAQTFQGCKSLTTVELPENITKIGRRAFYQCINLADINIPSATTTIEESAFSGCTSLTSVILPEGLKYIGNTAFSSTGLKNIVFPEGLETLGKYAFNGCYGLGDVYIPRNIVTFNNPFYGSTARLFVYADSVAADNLAYKETSGSISGKFISPSCPEFVVYKVLRADGTYCLSVQDYLGSDDDILLPAEIDGVLLKKVDAYGFKTASQIRIVRIPAGYDTIGYMAFDYAENMQQIYLPATITEIKECAFEDCDLLTDVYFDGTQEQWDNINIGDGNNPLIYATIHFANTESGVQDENGNQYGSVTEALENIASGGKLTLLSDVTEDVSLPKSITIDLNGNNLTGTITVAEDFALYILDSQTDDYTVEDDNGYGKVTNIQGTYSAAEGYLTVTEEDGVSFHKVNLKITAMSLRASAAGVYFNSEFAGDEVVAEYVQFCGIALSVAGIPTEKNLDSCKFSTFGGFTAGTTNQNSTLLSGIMKTTNSDETNSKNGEMPVYGRAYILTKDGRYVFGTGVKRSFRQQVEAIDAIFTQLTEVQQVGILEMYSTYKNAMDGWNIPNMKASLQ